MTLARALALGIALAVSGCGPAPPAPGDAAREFLPLVEGARWQYRIDVGIGAADVEVIARGMRDVPGLDEPVFVLDEVVQQAAAFGMEPVAPTAYRADGEFLRRYTGVDYAPDGSTRLLGHEDPAIVLPLSGAAGVSWSEDLSLLEQPGGGGGLVRFEGHTERVPSVRVPAGVFEDVLLVRIEYWDPDVDSEGPLISYEDTYARGIGLVRSVTTNEQDGVEMVKQELVSYRFPASE